MPDPFVLFGTLADGEQAPVLIDDDGRLITVADPTSPGPGNPGQQGDTSVLIPLSDETSALTASTSVAKLTIPYWPRTTELIDLPIWAVVTAPTGAALQFDIQINGTSVYLPASGGTYPTIAASSTNSTTSAGAFRTAFAASPTIAVGSSVAFFVRQVGSTVAGVNLKTAMRISGGE